MPVFVLIIGLLLIGVLEITVMVAVSNLVSWEATLLLLILAGAVGAWVVKREGTATWRRVVEGLRAGQVPTASVLDGCLAVVAGVLLLLPGFITDVVALALAVPAVRRMVRTRTVESMQRRVAAQVSRTRTGTVFGFGTPSPFGSYGPEPGMRGRPRGVDDDIIDLDAEEVVFLDEPIAEIEPPRDRPA